MHNMHMPLGMKLKGSKKRVCVNDTCKDPKVRYEHIPFSLKIRLPFASQRIPALTRHQLINALPYSIQPASEDKEEEKEEEEEDEDESLLRGV